MKISQYPALATPALTDVLPIVQNGVTLKATMQQVSDLIAPAAAASLNVPATVNASISTHDASPTAHGSVLANFTAHKGFGGVAQHPVATTIAAGFVPVLSGVVSDTLRGNGSWGGAATSDFLSDLVNFENDISDTFNLGSFGPTPFARLFRIADNGTLTDYAITLPNPATGVRKMIAFEVRRQGLATKQFSITPFAAERIGGKAGGAVFKLIAGNKLWLMSDGFDWIIIAQQLDTEWLSGGAVALSASGGGLIKGSTVGGTDVVWWRRQGSDLLLRFDYKQTAIGTRGVGRYQLTIPIGSIDITNVYVDPVATFMGSMVGQIQTQTSASNTGSWHTVFPISATALEATGLAWNPSGAADCVFASGTGRDVQIAGFRFMGQARLPIVGW